MDDIHLLIDLHKDGERQGPGSESATELALALSGLSGLNDLTIADVGCGTGASTRVLARRLRAHITAVDVLPEFLDVLKERAVKSGLHHRIETLAASMDRLPFADASLDAIWAEGAIYNIGFVRGITAWQRLLKPGGILAVSELTWLTSERPEALQRHWEQEYPEVATASHKIAQLEAAGYKPIGYFPLPPECWQRNYYDPLRGRFADFLIRHRNSAEARQVVEGEKKEIALFESYHEFFSYGFYLAQRVS